MDRKFIFGLAAGWSAGCVVMGAIAHKAMIANTQMIARQSLEIYRPVIQKMAPYVPIQVLEEIATDAAFEDIISQEGLK